MCTINPTTGSWGEVVTITGTGFGAPIAGLPTGTVTLEGTAQGTILTWNASAIEYRLPSILDADATYRVTIQPLTLVGLGSACTGDIAISTPATTVSVNRVLNTVTVTATSGTFGAAAGTVRVGSRSVTPIWSQTSIAFDITGIPAGTYEITITRTNATTVIIPSFAIDATPPPAITTTVLAMPDPTNWGARLTLSAVGLPFRTAPDDLRDKVTVDDNGTIRSLDVQTWTATQIIATLPVPTVRTYGDRVLTIHDGSASEPTCTLHLQAGAAQLLGNVFPDVQWQSVLGLGQGLVVQTELLRSAVTTGTKWRYEYLKEQAALAASRAHSFEANVLQLMQLALSKVASAEQLLNPILIEAIKTLQHDIAEIQDLANNTDIQKAIGDLAASAARALLLEALLVWLVGHDVIEFWIGLFEALIDDVCSFDSDLGHVDAYLHDQFEILRIDGQTVTVLVQGLLTSIDRQVETFTSALRQAAAEVVGATSKQMAEALGAFDMPLTAKVTGPGAPDIMQIDPLAGLEGRLLAAVDGLVDQLKSKIQAALDGATSALEDMFVDVLTTFVVYPVVAMLAIGFALGGFGAAILCALILIAVEELIHLIASWLTGPLLSQLDELKHQIADAVGRITAILAREAALLQATSPAALLTTLSAELRALTDIVPEKFLDELADVLGRARDVVMRGALFLASSAEQALGLENATAFDAISLSYRSVLTPSLLPGARDQSLFAGAALLRDLGKLEQQRAAIIDGKELVVTHRLSILELLGGDRAKFLDTLRSGQLLVHLTEEVLLDRKFPGLYRAIIEDIRVRGVFETGLTPVSSAVGVPVSLTHQGLSWTRIKRNANPFAPPLEKPRCLANPGQYGDQALVDGVLAEALSVWRRNHPKPQRDAAYKPLDDSYPDPDSMEPRISVANAWRAWIGYVPSRLAADLSGFCGYVDASVVEAGVRELLERAAQATFTRANLEWAFLQINLLWYQIHGAIVGSGFPWLGRHYTDAEIIEAYVDGTGPAQAFVTQRLAADSPLRPRLFTSPEIVAAQSDARDAIFPTQLRSLWDAAFGDGIARFEQKIAKWGNAKIVADPDPAITAAGFVVLQREQPPETSVHHLFPSESAAQQLATPVGANEVAHQRATAQQYRPFENRGLGGQLLLSFPALDPTRTTGDLLGLPDGATSVLPPVTDFILDITVRGCHDEQLSQTVKSNNSRRASFARSAGAVAADIAGTLPAAARAIGSRRTSHFSLRAHRDRTLEAWAIAATKGLTPPVTAATPLAASAGFLPLTGEATNRTFSLVLHKTSTFDVLALADLEDTLHVATGDLGLPAVDALADLAFREVSVALVPFAGSDPMSPLPIPEPLGTVTFGDELAAIAPSTMSRKRLFMPTDLAPTALVLANALHDDGTPISVNIPDTSALYDVIFSITYDLPSLRVDATTVGVP